MRTNRTLLIATLALIAIVLLTLPYRTEANRPPEVPRVLRARSLEIVDEAGRVRALLAVMPPTTVDGKDYPETVLLRLIDPKAGPVVKLTAAENGSALNLSDDGEGGVMIFGRREGSPVKMVDREGKVREVRP